MRVLLDSCAYLVATHESSRLPMPARRAMTDAQVRWWSAAGTWEIAMKASLGRFDYPDDVVGHLDPGLASLRTTLLPVNHLHAKQVRQLPWIHRDPFDRLLVAQAILERAAIITSDRNIAQYPGVTVIWD